MITIQYQYILCQYVTFSLLKLIMFIIYISCICAYIHINMYIVPVINCSISWPHCDCLHNKETSLLVSVVCWGHQECLYGMAHCVPFDYTFHWCLFFNGAQRDIKYTWLSETNLNPVKMTIAVLHT